MVTIQMKLLTIILATFLIFASGMILDILFLLIDDKTLKMSHIISLLVVRSKPKRYLVETEDSDEVPSSNETVDFSEEKKADRILKKSGSDYGYVYCEII